MREPKEVERFLLPQTTSSPALGRETAELDEAGLPDVQLESELRESFAQLFPEPLGLGPMLEPDHDVVSKANDDDVTAGVLPPPVIGP